MSGLEKIQDEHLAVIIPFRQLAFGCYRERGNASFSLRHMKNKDRAPSSHAHQDAEEATIYLYTSKDKAEKTQEPRALQLA